MKTHIDTKDTVYKLSTSPMVIELKYISSKAEQRHIIQAYHIMNGRHFKHFRRHTHKRKVGENSSSEDDEPSPKPRRGKDRKKDRHLVKWCPVAGCRAKPQARLSSHIKSRHLHIPKTVREEICKRATPNEKEARTTRSPKGHPINCVPLRQGEP